MAFGVGTIYGVGLGFEYFPDDGEDEVVKSAVTIDVLIFRFYIGFLR